MANHGISSPSKGPLGSTGKIVPPHLRTVNKPVASSSNGLPDPFKNIMPASFQDTLKSIASTVPHRPNDLRPNTKSIISDEEDRTNQSARANATTKESLEVKPSDKASVTTSKGACCTYANCKAAFKTVAQMKSHKADRHDYCSKCDMDFEDDDALLRHKIGSDWALHITCPVCGEDFRSTGGKDRHVQLIHSKEQNIRCRGCGEIFIRAGGLMEHIEKNRCSQITSAMFERQRTSKALQHAYFSTLKNAERDELGIGPQSDLEELSEEALPHDIVDENPFPPLAPNTDPKKVKETELEDNLIDLSFDEKVASPWSAGGKTATKLFPGASKTLALSSSASNSNQLNLEDPENIEYGPLVSKAFFGTDFKQSGPTLTNSNGAMFDPTSPQFNPYDFKNAIGKFKCPYPGCGKYYDTPGAFKAHLSSLSHKGVSHRCPCCLKIFKSPTALTQHMESPATRCKIKESNEFKSAVRLTTGGYIDVTGRHEDGTFKFDAA